MTLPSIELVSFKLCPFVQRSVITLLEKGIEFKTTYIELSDKPDWFLAISPLGKVPVLRIGDEVLFESAVINEFLDEITPPSLHPSVPLEKARQRAWIEFSSDIMQALYNMTVTGEEQAYKELRTKVVNQLSQLEDQITGPFFSGERFSLVDTAYAPFFMRAAQLESFGMESVLSEYPKVAEWSKQLLSRPSVQNSVVDDFNDLAFDRLQQTGSYLAGHLSS